MPDLPSSALPYHVAKFGGTSVGTPGRVRAAVALAASVPADQYRRVVVSSAFGGVTDGLLEAIASARDRDGRHPALLGAIRARHDEALTALAPPDEREALGRHLATLFNETADLLQGVYLLRECTPRFQDAILSAGERASVPLVAAAFRAAGHDALALDATAFVRTDDAFGEASVDFEATGRLVREALGSVPAEAFAVVTGFVASTGEGVTTTLGRSGSDYTATILAGALDAAECVIWTDVDGVLSADPRLVPDAFSLAHLAYEEAAELAHFGAKVLHPRTMRPVQRAGIPLRIKNTLRPEHPGTTVGPKGEGAGEGTIKALTAVRGAALVRIVGSGINVAALAAEAFGALAGAGVEVLMVAQASAEGSLCLAVREASAPQALRVLRAALARELERGDVLSVEAESGAAVVAAVGSALARSSGLAGRMFATLGRAHVNVHAIAHGASEHTLSAAVSDAEASLAVGALHEAFALRRLRAHVAVVGAGVLGQRLLALLGDRAEALREGGLNLRLVGLASSRRHLFEPSGLDPSATLEALGEAGETGLEGLMQALSEARLERLVVVDATASPEVAARHAEWLRAGIAVVTPNKAVTLWPPGAWDAADRAAREGEAPYLYEAAVGAGLGIVARVRDLVRTGDRVESVEGVLSGTLAFVLGAMQQGTPFSAAVREARARGLAEPDPRDDLSGRDVARKLALLAREAGIDADPGRAEAESLVPPALADVPLEAFWDRLPEADEAWQERLAEASGPLHYVARLDAEGRIRAGVQPLGPDAPFGGLAGTSVAVAFRTRRYGAEPVVLRGPGATADVTAAVLLADIVRAAEAMR